MTVRTAIAAAASALLAAPAAAQTIAVIDADEVRTVGPAGVIEGGDVVIKDGRIAAVGADLSAPTGAQVIDGAGMIVTPGFIAPLTGIGVQELGLDREANDLSPRGEFPFSAALDAADAFDPSTTTIAINRAGGITRAYATPEPGDALFAGRGVFLHLGGGADPVMEGVTAQLLVLDYPGARNAGGDTRMGAWARLRDMLTAAEDYRSNPRRYADLTGADRYAAADLEALEPVLSGERPLLVYADGAEEIARVLDLKTEYDLDVVLVGAREAWRVAEDLAAANVPVILNPMENLPSNFAAIGATLENAARLEAAGVKVSFNDFDTAFTHNVRLLPQYAGNAIANGLPPSAALRGLTLTPAEIFNVEDRLGSLEAGKIADVVVWDGDPFEVTTRPAAVIIDGKVAPLDSRQSALRERYRDLSRGELPFAYRGEPVEQ